MEDDSQKRANDDECKREVPLPASAQVAHSTTEDTKQQPVISVVTEEEEVHKKPREVPRSARHDITAKEMREEFSNVAIPTVVAVFFMFLGQTITMSFVGHRLGFKDLASYSVGVSVFNIFGASVGIGVAGAVETLGPQAFGRDAKSPEISHLLQRGTIVNIILWVPISLAFYCSEPALVAVYGPDMGKGAAEFLRNSPVYLFLFWTAAVVYKLLAAQQLVNVMLFSYVLGSGPAAYIINYYWLPHGSSVGQAVWNLCGMQVVVLSMLLGGAWYHPKSIMFPPKGAKLLCPEAWDKEKLTEYCRIAASSAASVCSEWWAFEVLQIVAAQVGPAEVAAFTVMLSVLVLFFSFAAGISTGGGTMIGNALGANEPALAKRYTELTARCGVISMTSSFCCVYFFGEQLVTLYTTDEEVLGLIRPIRLLFAIWQLGDALQCIWQSVFRGAGQADRLARLMLICLWLVGLPGGIIGGIYMKLGLKGIVGGQLVALLGLGCYLTYDVMQWDYAALAAKASQEPGEDWNETQVVQGGSSPEPRSEEELISASATSHPEDREEHPTTLPEGGTDETPIP